MTAGAYRSVADHYAALVAGGDLTHDPDQADAAARFDRVANDLATPRRRRGLLAALRPERQAVRGLYLHGDVGRGKTMLMDMFFDTVAVPAKRRDHFSAFMADVHERIHAVREDERTGRRAKGDPVAPVAEALAAETRLLCLDEFAVTDIADAMILARLFTPLFGRGLVLVTTSNVAPDDLYLHGLNRGLFLPFIDLLRDQVEVVRFGAGTDYRLEMLSGRPIYLTPVDADARSAVDALWHDLTLGAAAERSELRFKGRTLPVPLTACGAARFSFADLCEAPLGPNDYLAIARTFHTVVVDDVPVIAADRRDVARRFILLIDALYDQRVKLVASAAAAPEDLYRAPTPLGTEYRRTSSRIAEMQSASYLGASHGGPQEAASGAAGPAVASPPQSG